MSNKFKEISTHLHFLQLLCVKVNKIYNITNNLQYTKMKYYLTEKQFQKKLNMMRRNNGMLQIIQ